MSKSKLFVPYEMALELKEKGYPNHTGSCLAAWEKTENAEWLHFGSHPVGLLQAPLYQEAVDWLRDKHDIIIDIQTCPSKRDGVRVFKPVIFVPYRISLTGAGIIKMDSCEYYRALKQALTEALKLI